jgi:hypothetical protein
MQIADIINRNNLNSIKEPLRMTRLSRMDIYEQIIILQEVDLHIPLAEIPLLEERLVKFAELQFKCRN